MRVDAASEKLKAYAELNAMTIDADQIDRFMQDDDSPDYFLDLGSLYDELVTAFDDTKRSSAPRLPFSSTQRDFALRPNEVSIWFGIDGHGKSMIVSHAILDLMAQGQRCALMSLEMPLGKTAKRMARQAIGNESPTLGALASFCRWGQGKLWFYREPGVFRLDRLMGAIRYAVKVLKVQHFVLDNLTCMLKDDDDNTEQKQIIQRLCVLARDLGVHIHVVAHSRKLDDEFCVPARSALKGSGALLAQADNVLIVWRNTKPKEQRSAEWPCDAVLVIAKQRHHDGPGEDLGSWGLWYDARSQQFKDYENAPIRRYVAFQREPGED